MNGVNGVAKLTNSDSAINETLLDTVKLHPKLPGPLLFTISAKDEKCTQAMLKALGEYLSSGPAQAYSHLRDLAYTLNERRSNFGWRAAVSADSTSRLIDSLHVAKASQANPSQTSRLGFVFTGQGAQWHAMGRELIITYPLFANALQRADQVLHSLGSKWSVLGENPHYHLIL